MSCRSALAIRARRRSTIASRSKVKSENMELTRRYLFNGSAAAYGGRFVRPDDVVLASSGGSALSITGGRSVWRDRDIKLGRSFRIRSAETFAEGLVDSLRDAVRVTHRQLPADALAATTRV